MEQLTTVDESERFKALNKGMDQVAFISSEDLEGALASLCKKNVSTLICLYIKSKSQKLYHLTPTAKQSLENTEGSFPNIAYCYAGVQPSMGIRQLYRLYDHHPNKRMAICLSIGSTKRVDAFEFLVSKAKSEKRSGKSILSQLCGLKITSRALSAEDVFPFLNQKLDREEVIALSEIPVKLTNEHSGSCGHPKGTKESSPSRWF